MKKPRYARNVLSASWFQRTWVLVAFLFFGLIGAVVLAFVPPPTMSSVHSWEVRQDASVLTGLARPSPESVILSGNCPSEETDSYQVFEADNWSVQVKNQSLRVYDFPQSSALLEVALPEECSISLNYSLSSAEVRVNVIEPSNKAVWDSVIVPVANLWRLTEFTVSGFGEPVFSTVDVETFPWGLSFSPFRFAGQLLVFAAVALSTVALIVGQRGEPRAPHQLESVSELTSPVTRNLTHVVVFAALIAGMMLMPSYFDDGWILQRLRDSLERNLFANPIDSGDVWLTLGIWLEHFLKTLLGWGVSFEFLRVLVAGVLWWGWWFLIQTLERFGFVRFSWDVVGAAAVFLAFSLTFLMTIRPEPVITSLVALFFVGFLGFIHQFRAGYLLLAGVTAVAAVTAHQTGFVLLFPALILVIFAVRQAWLGKVPWLTVGVSVFVSVLFGLGLGLIDYDLATLVRETNFLSSVSYNQYPESHRWEWLFSRYPGWKWWPVFVAAVASLVAFSRLGQMSSLQRLLLLATVSTPLGLFFTASKWAQHVGVLTIPAVIAVFLALPIIREMVRDRTPASSGLKVTLTIVFLLAFLKAVAEHRPYQWTYPYRRLDAGLVGELFPDWEAIFLWSLLPLLPILVYSLILGMNYLRPKVKTKLSKPIGVMAVVLVLAPVGNFYGMLVADSILWGGWTPLKQRAMSLVGIENCGLLDEIDMVIDADSVGVEQSKRLPEQGGPFELTYFTLAKKEDSISYETLEASKPIAIWVKSTEGESEITLQSVQIPSDHNPAEQRYEVDADMWSLIEIPENNQQDTPATVIVSLSGNNAVEVSHLAVLTKEQASKELPGTTVFSGPPVSTYLPCTNEPRIIEGLWEKPDYVLDNNTSSPFGYHRPPGQRIEVGFQDGIDSSFVRLLRIQTMKSE